MLVLHGVFVGSPAPSSWRRASPPSENLVLTLVTIHSSLRGDSCRSEKKARTVISAKTKSTSFFQWAPQCFRRVHENPHCSPIDCLKKVCVNGVRMSEANARARWSPTPQNLVPSVVCYLSRSELSLRNVWDGWVHLCWRRCHDLWNRAQTRLDKASLRVPWQYSLRCLACRSHTGYWKHCEIR